MLNRSTLFRNSPLRVYRRGNPTRFDGGATVIREKQKKKKKGTNRGGC